MGMDTVVPAQPMTCTVVGQVVFTKDPKVDLGIQRLYTMVIVNNKELKLRKVLGTAGVVLGMLALAGLAGGVTELGPEAGVNEYLNILSTALVSGCLINLGMFMMKDDT